MSPGLPGLHAGERFFDHYDLAALEDTDFSPDGRDLGENYTYTRWRMSPCVKSGKLSCMHCHHLQRPVPVSIRPEDANKACLPCHEERVENAAAHSRHPEEATASRCVSCHMPRPSSPGCGEATTRCCHPRRRRPSAFKSPNACNLCHPDKKRRVGGQPRPGLRPRDYQAPVLRQAGLVAAARKAGVEAAAGDPCLPGGEGS